MTKPIEETRERIEDYKRIEELIRSKRQTLEAELRVRMARELLKSETKDNTKPL